MSAITKIGLDYETMHQQGERWESPEDIIHYVRGGLAFLAKTNDTTDPETIEKRNRWIKYAQAAINCLDIL